MLLIKFLLHLSLDMLDAHLICIWIHWFVVYTIAAYMFFFIHALIKNLGGITRGI